ncbi:MAG: 1-acyl-sn-glycerol-3-phosphate acyltransferase [Chrysiogenetes bacterium]|nr:1-acyl-sn-glycerol-3-phosphate acyltransferase [Chrysiogenetes bacterium]
MDKKSDHVRASVPAWQFWKHLQPQKDVGMSDAEARDAGILPPLGWQPPGYSAMERIHSIRAWLQAAFRFPAILRASDALPGVERERYICRELLGALGVELTISGTENCPPAESGAIFMWNQTSHLDHLILGAIADRRFRSLYNVELSRMPLYGKWLKRQQHYLVDRYDEDQWRGSIAQAAQDVRERGISILVSPEGTRSWDGRLLPMKRGAFILAIEARAPIIPIRIVGADRALPRGSHILRRERIQVRFLEPVDPTPYSQDERAALESLVAARLESPSVSNSGSAEETPGS